MFKIDRNRKIMITQGDTGELDVRIFNKDWNPPFPIKKDNKINRFLYKKFVSDYDYYGNADFDIGACSSFKCGSLYGRNFDWTYNDLPECIVETPRTEDRFATIGIASNIKDIKKANAYVVDGMNEKGVVANINIVNNDFGDMAISLPNDEELDRIDILVLPRYIIDNFETASEAVDFIVNHLAITNNLKLISRGMAGHIQIADKWDSYVLEFIPDSEGIYHNTIIESDKMTNFYLTGVEFNEDGSVNNVGDTPIESNNLTPYSQGIERWNMLIGKEPQSSEEMLSLMSELFFTNAYKEDWLSEFVGLDSEGMLTIDSQPEDFEDILVKVKEAYKNRSRFDNKTWQTTHSVVYDLENLQMHLINQESEYTFDLFDYRCLYRPEKIWPKNTILQEEIIRCRDNVTLRVSRSNEIVLEKENDEWPDTIFLSPEDTKDLDVGLYTYSLTYTTYFDEEVNTVVNGFFEVKDKNSI